MANTAPKWDKGTATAKAKLGEVSTMLDDHENRLKNLEKVGKMTVLVVQNTKLKRMQIVGKITGDGP